ncbi:acyloxyacyl hydrolase [Massilia sp. P8910]|uniref:acyloxyacyl hydrolase n=1 Tax=Massilia antarctica TaxID=2765360 RepID=UPI000ADCCE0F|nr:MULTISPECIES: acyloxyacyl hydrolase [Massilia]MCE3603048.1 acyloxyacyl hydrolase [Massilia antarctica]MCY0915442.1 acyloxyacyl hydrolase [Massilia sp. H27-R4]
MSLLNMKLCASLATLAAMAAAPPALASDKVVDHASLEFGGGAKVQMVRFGVQKDWERRWFQSNGTHVSGYWDASIAQWRGNAYQNVDGRHQNITNIGFTPVFRFQADDMRGWYAEAGVGLNLLSKLYDNDSNRLSTAFQFGDHLGVGYVFANQWDVGMKVQHFSNGGYKEPNSGVNFLVLKASRRF